MMLATIDLADGNYEDALKRMTTSEGQTVTGTGDSADYYLVKVLAYQLMRDSVRARSCADSARVVLQNVLQRDQSPWEEAMSRMQLAKAHAGLGNSEDAVREAEKAVELLPVSKDALDGSGLILDMAVVYAATGQPERAIDQLEYLLSIPNWFSAAYLKIAPDLAPLRGNPRFEALLQQEDVVF
jgi:tetratricopeptide (TPR) repeat protein